MNDPSLILKSIGYGLVGFGRFCRRRLLPAFQQIRGSKIVALQKRDRHEARREAEKYGIPAGYGDIESLLSDPHVDAVYITSANCAHEEQAVAAAQAGKHVLCEKPLATSSEGCRRIIAACRSAGVLLMVAQTLRFSPLVLQIKRWIAEGILGEIVTARATFSYRVEESPRNWVFDPEVAGGGPMVDVGVHCLDTLRFLMGDVSEVQAIVTPAGRKNNVERTVEVVLRFASGVTGGIFCSYEIPYSSRLEVVGSYGRAYAESFTLPWADLDLHLETKEQSKCLTVNTGNMYGDLITSFSQAIRGLQPVAIPGEEGLANQEIIDAIYRG